MPSHIFARLGLWQDDINSNLAAIQIADQWPPCTSCFASQNAFDDFLEYAYLQIGDDPAPKPKSSFRRLPDPAADLNQDYSIP